MSHYHKFWKIVELQQNSVITHLGVWEKVLYIIYRAMNTVILKLLKSNTNLQFVTGVYAMLTYLTSYLC